MFVQVVERDVRAHARVESEFHSQAFNQFNLATQDRLRKAILGQSETKHSAGFRLAVEDADIMAEHVQIKRRSEPGRAGTDNRDLAASGLQLTGDDRLDHGLVFFRGEDGIGDEAMNLAHVHRLIDRLAAAAAVAWMLAYAPGGRGKRVVENDR